jgi:hypothetical protein
MATPAKPTGFLPRMTTASGRLISPVEMRRQNEVLRRLIEHVRNYSPEVDLEFADRAKDDAPPMAHRRPLAERGPLE